MYKETLQECQNITNSGCLYDCVGGGMQWELGDVMGDEG